MIKNRFYSLNLIRCFSVILISAQIFFNTNANPEIQPPDYDTIFDDSFLQVISTINSDIKSFVCRKNQIFINYSFINKDDIKLLSRSCKDDYECRQKKKSSLNKLKKELESLERIHTFLCLQILEVLKNDIRIKNLNPNHTFKIKFLHVYEYEVRMISFFIYGKFVVNPWQYNLAKRLIDIVRLEYHQKKDTMDIILAQLNDSALLSSMNEFCDNCKLNNEFLKSIILLTFNTFKGEIGQFLNRKSLKNYVNNLLSKTKISCVTKMNRSSYTHINKANQKEMVIDKDYENIKKVFLQSLKLNKYDDEIFKKNEIHFFNKDLWEKLRNKRLPSSHFHCTCSFNQTKNKEYFLKKTLRIWNKNYEDSDTKDNIPFPVQYGIVNEPKAIELFEKKMNIKIEMCAKFIDEKINYLTAKPDGIIGKDGIVEIKCPVKAQYMTPEKAIKDKVIKYVHYNENEDLVLKRTSDTFYEIQGELHITQRQYCYLIIWTPKGIVYCKILRDDKFWNDYMEPKLIYFYEDFMLPELLNIHLTKDLNITNI
ncbi:uncharacterized protein LOC126896997 isoform X3 [Daktulosphaira vitifoliae]|uniref:uncharacterized protein LOC126896997 isoform X3 n=1 Tax=Daktulosphaira vitifoliae TaxID=58002 RepID=UPI0021AAFF96|nr:uncharacterized protein LOC126896997 isoform X3 [Daktulosphaira vitifoliae]